MKIAIIKSDGMEGGSGRLRPLQDGHLVAHVQIPLGSAVCQGVNPFGNPLFTGNKLPANN